jgi:hypothetical protein
MTLAILRRCINTQQMKLEKKYWSLNTGEHGTMTRPAKKENEMKRTNGNWLVNRSTNQIGMPDDYSIVSKLENGDFVHLASITGIDIRHTTQALIDEYDTQRQANAKLMASAPAMLELLKNILGEVRPEISRVNEEAGQTIFNPVATETIDMAKALISKAEGRREGIVS